MCPLLTLCYSCALILHLAVGVIWSALNLVLPQKESQKLVSVLILNDIVIIGFFFILTIYLVSGEDISGMGLEPPESGPYRFSKNTTLSLLFTEQKQNNCALYNQTETNSELFLCFLFPPEKSPGGWHFLKVIIILWCEYMKVMLSQLTHAYAEWFL